MSGKFNKTTLSMLGKDGVNDIQKSIISELYFNHKKINCPMCIDLLQSREYLEIPICQFTNDNRKLCGDCPIDWSKLRIIEREKAIDSGEIGVDSQNLSGDKALAHGLSPSNPAPLDSHFIRESVKQFSILMECKLRNNEYKGNWKNCSNSYLIQRAFEELQEVKKSFQLSFNQINLDNNLVFEAVDVANFCMMIFDNNFDKNKIFKV